MKDLLESITAVVSLLSPEKVEVVAAHIRKMDMSNNASIRNILGTSVAEGVAERLIQEWKKHNLSTGDIANMLLAACHSYACAKNQESLELVWTGPTTPFVSARQTEQALLQVINFAQSSLFIVSFVAYEIPSIMKALNVALSRGVNLSMLMELSKEHGGSIDMDVLGKMRSTLPSAKLYVWREKADAFIDGRVHAKIASADSKICFITSANLTGYAMEKNMEAGILVSGGNMPQLIHSHLQALIDTKLISPL